MSNAIDAMLQFNAEALGMRAQRQQMLASNIANADTPGYKARDIDFVQSLQNALSTTATPNELMQTAPNHMAAPQQGRRGSQTMYRSVVQPSLDGNTVDIDVEIAQFGENAVHYEANLAFINAQLKSMLAALQE